MHYSRNLPFQNFFPLQQKLSSPLTAIVALHHSEPFGSSEMPSSFQSDSFLVGCLSVPIIIRKLDFLSPSASFLPPHPHNLHFLFVFLLSSSDIVTTPSKHFRVPFFFREGEKRNCI